MATDAPEPQRRLRDQVVHGVGWNAVRMGANILFQFVTIVVVSRYLSPAEVGVVAVGFGMVQLISLVSLLGVHGALVQRIEVAPRHIGAACAVAAVGNTVWFLLICLAAGWLAQLLDLADLAAVLPALSVVLFLNAGSAIFDALLRRDMKFATIATADLLATGIAYSLVSIAGAISGFGLWSLVAGHLAGHLTRTVFLGASQAGRLRFRTSFAAVRDLLRYGVFAAASVFVDRAAETLDRVLVGATLGSGDAGLFVRGAQVVQISVTAITFPLGTVLFPVLSRLQHDPPRLRRAYCSMQALMALVSLPAVFVILVTSPSILPFLLGHGWSDIVGPVQVLAIALFFRAHGYASGILLNAMGKVRRRVPVEILYFVLVLGAILVLARWGLEWVCLGIVASIAVRGAVLGWLAAGALRLSFGDQCAVLVPGAAATAIMAACVGIAYLWIGPLLFDLAGSTAILLLAGAAMVYLLLFDTRLGLPEELVALRSQIRRWPFQPGRGA